MPKQNLVHFSEGAISNAHLSFDKTGGKHLHRIHLTAALTRKTASDLGWKAAYDDPDDWKTKKMATELRLAKFEISPRGLEQHRLAFAAVEANTFALSRSEKDGSVEKTVTFIVTTDTKLGDALETYFDCVGMGPANIALTVAGSDQVDMSEQQSLASVQQMKDADAVQ